MRKNRPGFWSYFKSLFTSEIEVKGNDGKRYYKHDMLPRLIIAGASILMFLLLTFLKYGDEQLRLSISMVVLVIVVLINIPVTYLFAKFEEIKENEDLEEKSK